MRHNGMGEQDLGVTPLMLFVPLIIGAGGNCGAQVTTTLTRSLAVGDVNVSDWFRVLRREFATAVVIGSVLGLLGFLRAQFGWRAGMDLSLVVAISLPIVVLWATSVGSLLPLMAKRLKIDPAVMSAPFITTLVDATGLIIYFEIALRLLPVKGA
jgi:magnesium transporter